MLTTSDTSEKGLETLIEQRLLASGYEKGYSADYDKAFCLDTKLLFRFLEATQPDELAKLKRAYGDQYQRRLCKRLSDQIRKKGVVEVLRGGVRDRDAKLTLFYKRPASTLNEEAHERYEANVFSVTRQLYFSEKTGKSLDMVLFINGIPLITFELKNHFSGQNVQHAIRQYQRDRDPSEPLFGFARCLVHFAVDDDLAYMTTHLRGTDTFFLPFNKGHAGGGGNPPNPNGLRTAYLWEEVLQKDLLSDIVQKYAQIVEEPQDDGSKKRKLIFPRYHQLDVVRALLAHAKTHGPGRRYLIQHSAGSGKSNSITWAAHQLVGLTDETDTDPVFDSVIVVTDRRQLDRQIRDNIRQFAQVGGVVEAITEGSRQLRQALEAGKKIIITTVQKFPYILSEIGELPQSTFAILIDEAHSSQGGSTTAAMNLALGENGQEDEKEETAEDKINRLIEGRKLLANASYFAFTATPKNKTLEVFGRRRPDGTFAPFHLYSMKQAIEEEFILDVLQHYTTYQSYYALLKKAEDDPRFDTSRAKKKLRSYVESHQATIEQKARIMIDHFMSEVVAKRKVDGRARAMVVTKSIRDAIHYKWAFDRILKESGSPYRALIAFSGSKEIDGQAYDEARMNGFPGSEIAERFRHSPEYRFLIVANKFQTGYDEPLLHTMYVDKKLAGVRAVQTLSRLNRTYPPYKTDTFVLDFFNTVDEIKEAFAPYYTTTVLSEETDPNKLTDLQEALNAYQVYSEDNVRVFTDLYVGGAERDELDPIIDTCVERFKSDLTADEQVDFKAKARSFTRTYPFLSQILTFKNLYWERLYWFLKFLLTKLPLLKGEDHTRGLLESVDIDRVEVRKKAETAIKLDDAEGEIDPQSPEVSARIKEPELDFLSSILDDFNARYGDAEWATPQTRRYLLEDLPNEISSDEEFIKATKTSDRQNAKITFDQKLVDKFQDLIISHTELYKQFTDDPEFRNYLSSMLFKKVYEQQQAQ